MLGRNISLTFLRITNGIWLPRVIWKVFRKVIRKVTFKLQPTLKEHRPVWDTDQEPVMCDSV